jgi:uncharacterized damage-inducible protein DinB
MMPYGGKQLAASFRTVRNNTLMVAEEIPESQYDFRPAPGCRSVGETLVHIAYLHTVQTYVQTNRIDDMTKVNFPQLLGEIAAKEAGKRSKAEIVALLRKEGDAFEQYLAGLSDEFLAEPVKQYPGGPATKSRLEQLLSPKEHEMHHRGQLMVVQRMLGLTPHLTRQQQERAAQARQAAAANR